MTGGGVEDDPRDRAGDAARANAVGAGELGFLAAGSRVFAPGAADSSFRAAREWARGLLTANGPVPLVDAGELPPDAMVAAVSLVGSTTAFGEYLPGGDEPVRAVRALEGRLGERIAAVVPLNTAAENALLPLVAAASLGVPLVDGDGTGRVFPLLEQTTFALGGVTPAPLALAGPLGDVVVVDSAAQRVEELVRPLVLAAGGWVVAACYPARAGKLAESLVPGSVSRLVAAGRPGAPRAVAAPYGVRVLCSGRVTAVEQGPEPGPGRRLPSRPASILVREHGGLARLIRLEAYNEILMALADGAVAATAPDQICLISTADGTVVDVDRAAAGMDVEVVVLRAAPAWHTGAGRALGGPQVFGLGVPG
ncbi:DUF917 domain-containing protein [Bailinhaonella thermotolerans]|uniref:DUF917 domain-containing protein n=1 Tax=Bailinhaonella thermotolerans TaxID=1070861 RepID=A0A3A4ATU6_9ACTN|nr:DUF917 domain-containing protein [Bailinhaonella thermotolerans]RJL24848.1 DUF917 domain-containing protein [Bailinhaonella thermotolerans]